MTACRRSSAMRRAAWAARRSSPSFLCPLDLIRKRGSGSSDIPDDRVQASTLGDRGRRAVGRDAPEPFAPSRSRMCFSIAQGSRASGRRSVRIRCVIPADAAVVEHAFWLPLLARDPSSIRQGAPTQACGNSRRSPCIAGIEHPTRCHAVGYGFASRTRFERRPPMRAVPRSFRRSLRSLAQILDKLFHGFALRRAAWICRHLCPVAAFFVFVDNGFEIHDLAPVRSLKIGYPRDLCKEA